MTAIISPCGRYRYRLERELSMPFAGSKTFAYFGINPSTADAEIDDATVRKWKGFTRLNSGHRFIVGNIFAFRSTDPKALSRQDDPVGPEWLPHMTAIIADADVLVPCWGSLSKMPRDLRGAPAQILATLLRSGKPVLHFGVTSCGQPKHPLMLGYDTPLTEWATQGSSKP